MIKKVSLGFLILVSLMMAYNLVNQIMAATKSGERLFQSADILFRLEAKNRQLKDKLSKLQSAEFLEEQARNKLGFAKKGETVVVIPPEKLKSVLGASQSAQIRLPNWLGWLKVFWK